MNNLLLASIESDGFEALFLGIGGFFGLIILLGIIFGCVCMGIRIIRSWFNF